MGIRDLNKLLREECGGEYTRDVPARDFARRRLAVDAPVYLHKYVHTHDRESIVDAYVEMVVRFRENEIDPVFVFDGEALPEKRDAQAKRAAERRRQEDRVAQMERDLAETTEPSALLLANYAKHVGKPGALVGEVVYDRDEMTAYVARLRSRIVNVDETDHALMRDTLDAMGVAWVRAPHEAEMLCVQMCKQGMVAAVVSTDTDVLAAGGPVIVREMKNGRFVCVHYADVLEKLRMSPDQFTDLCIMCGTDFNRNVPGIGWKKSLKLIRQHVRIEDVPIEGKEVLNHVRVRQLFGHEHWPHRVPSSRPIRYDDLERWLASKGAATSVDSIRARVDSSEVQKDNYL